MSLAWYIIGLVIWTIFIMGVFNSYVFPIEENFKYLENRLTLLENISARNIKALSPQALKTIKELELYLGNLKEFIPADDLHSIPTFYFENGKMLKSTTLDCKLSELKKSHKTALKNKVCDK